MKRLYARAYFALLDWLARHEPGADKVRLPSRVIVDRVRFHDAIDSTRQGNRNWKPMKR